MRQQFADHIRFVSRLTNSALRVSAEAGQPFDGIVLHSGSAQTYHAQDREVSFQPVAHFARFAAVHGPDHFVVYRPGERPKLIHLVADDFWYEPPDESDLHTDALDVVTVHSLAATHGALGDVHRFAYIGNNPPLAQRMGISEAAVEPSPLLSALDWFRAEKTPYEIQSIRAAARRAADGHAVAHRLAEAKSSERAIHAAYLEATALLEAETPYTNITAWDDRAAILHYQTKRAAAPHPGHVFLIDAGASIRGYASDITRTYCCADAHVVFREILDRMQVLQRTLVARLRPGLDFVTLHEAAVLGVCTLLREVGVLRVEPAEALQRNVPGAFFPHGLGHHLGLQVHDVGGHLQSPLGERRAPPPQYPSLRNTRPLAPGHVITIEPGVYFIPMLLRALRASPDADCVAWDLVDQLMPCGGVRIEDDVHVTADGHDDLSRPYVPGAPTTYCGD